MAEFKILPFRCPPNVWAISAMLWGANLVIVTWVCLWTAALSGQVAESVRERANVPEDINDAFLDEQLDPAEWVERFEVESREIYASREKIVQALRLKSGTRIADIGCGTGLFVPLFALAVSRQGKVYGVDISPRLVEFVRDRIESERLTQVEIIQCDRDHVRLPDAAIDVAFVCDTYHHFEYPQDTLQSLRFALRPGGEMMVIDFERIPGKSREWVLNHVRAGKEVVRREIEQAGFVFLEEVRIDGFEENYCLRFRRP